LPADFAPDERLAYLHKKKSDTFRIFDSHGKLLAYAKKKAENNSMHPFLVFDSKNTSP
jgi:hypothetical protein